MGRSCFNGYLTDGCATCSDWADGTGDNGIGCGCHFPIHMCIHFVAMCEKEKEKRRPKKGNKIIVLGDDPVHKYGSIGTVISEFTNDRLLVEFDDGTYIMKGYQVRRATRIDF